MSPTARSGDSEAITSPTAAPSRGASSWNGGMYDFTSSIRPRM
jgi:hypothetical protein